MIVIDIAQTRGNLLRHPSCEIIRIIIELSTTQSSQIVPGTVRLLTSDQPRQVKISTGGAFDSTSLVIDPAPIRGPEALNTVLMHTASTVCRHSGCSPVISKADQPSVSHPSYSHTKRLMLRDSGRPYPPIQLLAQGLGGGPSAFAPACKREGFASTPSHRQSNEMNSVVGNSAQLGLCRKSSPSDASTDSGIYQQAMADNLDAVIGFIVNTHPLAAPQASSHSVIASSHWSTTIQSNSELQAFPYHTESLSQSYQCVPSTITFPPTQTAFSRSNLPHRSPVHDLTTPLRDAVELRSIPHIQQSLFFQPNRQREAPPCGIPDVLFHRTPSTESGTSTPWVVHASTMSQCFNDLFKHGANGATSASDHL
jgi:hypothetical protein